MHHLNHVHRRGAVYVWRRRMPARPGNTREFVQVSLRTREFSTAKLLAGLLNCYFYDFIMRVQTQVITRAEAQQFLTEVRSKELERIESERYAEPYATSSDEWQNRYLDERARPVALRKFAMMGPVAKLFQEDIAELLRDGVDQSGISRIKRHIEILANSCRDEFARETLELAKTRLNRSNFGPDDLRALSRIRLTGQADAMNISDHGKQPTPFIDLTSVDAEKTCAAVRSSPSRAPNREGYSDRLEALHEAFLTEMFRDVSDPAEQKKVIKARRQNGAVISQFREAVGKEYLGEVRQEDLHFYTTVLNRMPKVYGRSPKDRLLSLPELLERAEDLPDEKVGLAGGTINRNITILGSFLDFAANRGAKPAEALRMTALRKKKTEDERTARLAFTDTDVRKLALHPIWTGCLSSTRRNKPGNIIFKDALYWGPILAAASGARREEIMGLAVADIVLDAPVPHILIRPNSVRRLKNASSKRAEPIHSRLLDLGFSDYVKKMSVESDRDLFPELCHGSSAETYGNVFFKPWKSALDQQLGEEADRKTFHSFRHRVITFLRHKPGVDKAAVKDLVGHHHEDVTDSIYRDPAKILALKDLVEAIPVIF